MSNCKAEEWIEFCTDNLSDVQEKSEDLALTKK